MEGPTIIDWSVYAQLPKCTALLENTVNGILCRAEELQCYHTARMVKSKSNPSRPHLVQVFQDGSDM